MKLIAAPLSIQLPLKVDRRQSGLHRHSCRYFAQSLLVLRVPFKWGV
jgi:hypothetical protein